MAVYDNVQTVINGAAVELGLDPAVDVLTSTNTAFRQLRYLLDAAGQELLLLNNWVEFQEQHSITTSASDDGDYALPTNFAYMIPQAGWDRTNNNPLQGPLTPQAWQYLKGQSLTGQTLYVSFRLKQGKFHVFPDDPVPNAVNIVFEYVRNTWLENASEATTKYTTILANTDIVLYPPVLIKKFLKVKFLEAKGFESSKARDDFSVVFDAATGQDGSAPILNAGGARGFPFLDIYRNLPDTNYGV